MIKEKLNNESKKVLINKINKLWDNEDIERNVRSDYTLNKTGFPSLLWRINNMKYSTEELIKMYVLMKKITEESINKVQQQRIEKEKENNKGWNK